MIPVAVTVVVSVVAVELFLRLPLASSVASLMRYLQRASSVMRSRHISDHWKEKAMLAYSLRVARATLALAAIIVFIAAGCAAVLWLADRVVTAEPSTLHYVTTLPGLAVATVSASLYAMTRKHLAQ